MVVFPSCWTPKPTHEPNSATRPTRFRTNITSGVSALSSTSSAFGSAARSDAIAASGALAASIDETIKRQALAEEEAALNLYRVDVRFILWT